VAAIMFNLLSPVYACKAALCPFHLQPYSSLLSMLCLSSTYTPVKYFKSRQLFWLKACRFCFIAFTVMSFFFSRKFCVKYQRNRPSTDLSSQRAISELKTQVSNGQRANGTTNHLRERIKRLGIFELGE